VSDSTLDEKGIGQAEKRSRVIVRKSVGLVASKFQNTCVPDKKWFNDSPMPAPPSADLPPPKIADHELLCCIGQGSFGQVWLARNVMGQYRAVKVIYRASFDTSRPFDREFEAIKAYEPISRSHPGLLSILHVGKNQEDGYFYYIMELADDQIRGQAVEADRYEAKTLQSELHYKKRLPATECIQIGIALTDALDCLHQQDLIHRDIKLSNTVFVNGRPKLADLGLVTHISENQTFVGTEGYFPPEGPGSIQADIYGLGKVLYEISTGKDRLDFPEFPTDTIAAKERPKFLALNEIILKACKHDLKQRYKTAREMHEALIAAHAGAPPPLPPIWRIIGAVALAVIVAGAVVLIKTRTPARLTPPPTLVHSQLPNPEVKPAKIITASEPTRVIASAPIPIQPQLPSPEVKPAMVIAAPEPTHVVQSQLPSPEVKPATVVASTAPAQATTTEPDGGLAAAIRKQQEQAVVGRADSMVFSYTFRVSDRMEVSDDIARLKFDGCYYWTGVKIKDGFDAGKMPFQMRQCSLPFILPNPINGLSVYNKCLENIIPKLNGNLEAIKAYLQIMAILGFDVVDGRNRHWFPGALPVIAATISGKYTINRDQTPNRDFWIDLLCGCKASSCEESLGYLVFRSMVPSLRRQMLKPLTLPKGTVEVVPDRWRNQPHLKCNYEVVTEWADKFPSTVKVTIDLTPMREQLYKVK